VESAIKVIRTIQIAMLLSVGLLLWAGEMVGSIPTYALSESIALFGLILRLIGFSLSQVWSFYIAAFILLLFFRPRRPLSEAA